VKYLLHSTSIIHEYMYVYVHMWYYVYMFLSTGHDQALPFDPKLDELNYI